MAKLLTGGDYADKRQPDKYARSRQREASTGGVPVWATEYVTKDEAEKQRAVLPAGWGRRVTRLTKARRRK